MQLRITVFFFFLLPPALFSQTVVFQEDGVSSYTGTSHRIIAEGAPSANFTVEIASIDTNTEDYSSGVLGESQGLFKFDSIFGSGPGQVPLGSVIVAAELTTFSNNGTPGPISLHQLLSSWDPGTVSWNSFDNGINTNDPEAKSTPEDTKSGIATIATLNWDVQSSVQSWSDGNPNNGWVFITQSPDGWDVFSELYSTNPGQRPRLSITYLSAEQTVVFQEDDVSTYTGTSHRIIAEESPSANFTGELASIDTNTEDYSPSTGVFGESQGLFKFDSIFGSSAGQVPPGSFIVAAELTTFSNNGTSGPISLHQLLSSWDPGTVSWNSFVNGINANDLEARNTPEDTKSGIPTIATLNWDVRSSVQSWSNGNPNNGWVFITQSPDGWDVFTELYTTDPGQRPRLSITYSSAPMGIYDVAVTNITASSATISWKTSTASNSIVDWGLSAGSLTNQVSEAPFVTNHSIHLTSLPSDTTIYYQISSTDGGSFNESQSGNFDTEEGDFDIIRGPYLQNGGTTFVTVRWRTSMAGISKVHYGTNIGNLNQTATDPVPDTKHEIELTSLTENTRYYYQIETEFAGGGSTLSPIQSDTFFDTSPSNGDDKSTLWVIGDSGTANSEAAGVYNGFKGLFGPGEIPHADVWLMLGDNAYNKGTDTEFQNAVFDMYPELLRNSVLWPALGNHEALTPGATPFFDIFTMPEAGEAGGVASGTERYYSFDYGNIHFICLDSETPGNYSDIPGSGGMIDWLEADLIANTKDWTIAFFHHGPYTKGSHNSDTEIRHTSMRDFAIPLLESYGVDLTLTGHSHIYERSKFITGHHGLSSHSSTFNPASYLSGGNVVDGGNGSLIGEVDPFGNFLSNPALGDGPYRKPTISSDDGAVYVTAGASGSLRPWANGSNALVNPAPHPVHIVNLRLLGSLYIEVDSYTMDVSYIGTNSSIRDNFTISKGSYFKTQTEVDNFSATHGTGAVNGNLTILDDDDGSDPIVDLDGLSVLNYVSGDLIIENNGALASFCGLYPFYDTGNIDGNIFISGNIANPTTADILARGLCETYEDYYDWMTSFYLGATSQSVIGISADPDADFISNLQEWAYGLNPNDADSGGLELDGLNLITPGLPVVYLASVSTGVDFRAVFGRLTDWDDQDLEYKVQFSSDLATWYDSSDIPTYLDTNGTIDLVSVPYPFFLPNFTKAKFFRVVVSFAP